MVLIAGIVGLIASATLLVEKIEMLKDPKFVPSCSINPVVACGSVISTPQASIFGPPNPADRGVGVLRRHHHRCARGRESPLPRWFWTGLMIGSALAVVFVHWLKFETLYEIGALCPYCMVVWAVTIPLFVVSASIALKPLAGNPVARFLYNWRWPIVVLWFVSRRSLEILVRFWDCGPP